jgi:quercetin dioxygenase-like cupin family protein
MPPPCLRSPCTATHAGQRSTTPYNRDHLTPSVSPRVFDMNSSTDPLLSTEVEFADIPPEFAPTPTHPIRVRSRPMPAGVRIARHTHAWAQVAYASRGVLRVATHGTTWMVPPSRAIWVPPHVTHEVVIVEEAFLRTLYIDEHAVPPGLDACRVVEVSNLLREVIAALDAPGLVATREQALGALALDELTRSEPPAGALRSRYRGPGQFRFARTVGHQRRRQYPHDRSPVSSGTRRQLFTMASAGPAGPCHSATEPGAAPRPCGA